MVEEIHKEEMKKETEFKIIENIGKVKSVGELDIKRFINTAMKLPSFWN